MNSVRARRTHSILLLLAISLILVCIISIGLAPTINNAYAQELDTKTLQDNGTQDPGLTDSSIFTFTVTSDKECSVRLADKTVSRAIVPEFAVIDDKEYIVTSVAPNGFANSSNLEKVWLSKNIKTINSAAFLNCSKLKSITISEVETIGMNAFSMTGLDYLIIPETVTSIAATILRNCQTPVYIRASQEQVSQYDWHTDWNGYNEGNIEYESSYTPPIQYILVNSETELVRTTFSSRAATAEGYIVDSYQPFVTQSGVDIYIPAEYNGLPVIGIADAAFLNNNMSTITIGYSENPIRIGSYAFYRFEGNNITINREVIFQDDYGTSSEFVFASTKASTVILPNTIQEFGNSAFQECKELTDIHFIQPKLLSQTEEENLASTLDSTKKIFLPETVIQLGSEVFSGTLNINEIHIPSSVIAVGSHAFVGWDEPQQIFIDYEKETDLGIGWDRLWNNSCNLSIINYSTVQVYEIIYNLNGGVGGNNPSTYTSKDAFVLDEPEKIGYKFDGWYNNEQNVYVREIKVGTVGNMVLDAKWIANTYTIIYNENKPQKATGNITGATSDSIHTYDVEKVLTPNGYHLVGWTFIGWQDSNGNNYNDRTIVLNRSSQDNDVITFYAQWIPNDYFIKYIPNRPGKASNAVLGDMENSAHVYDESSALRGNEFSLKGWTFVGWLDSEGVSYKDKQSISTAFTGGTSVLLAQWEQNNFTVEYKGNKPSDATHVVEGTMSNSSYKYDEKSTLISNLYSLFGWKFNGWNTDSMGGGKNITDKGDITNLVSNPDEKVVIYAQWIPWEYSVVFSDGQGQNKTVKCVYDSETYVNSDILTKKGYHIIGWTSSIVGNCDPSFTIYNWANTEGAIINLNAQWEANVYDIIYNANGGVGTMPKSQQFYDAPLELSKNTFTRDGYSFAGWGEKPEGPALSWIVPEGGKVVHNFVDSGSVTLYAQWKADPITYSIRLSGYCKNCGASSKFNPTSHNLKSGQLLTKKAPDSCGNSKSALTSCGAQFRYWEITSDKGKSWTDSNQTISVKDFTNIRGEHFEIKAIYEGRDSSGSCVAEGTLITLADGTQKLVEQLMGSEQLLVWNLFTGKFDVAPILFIDNDPAKEYEVINLYFSDGTSVKVIDEHGFWDYDLNKYVFLRKDASQYIGHWFNKQTTDANGNLVNARVQLEKVVVQTEYTSAWSPVTYGHLCYYVNGMLSMPGATTGIINIFDVDPETMKIDEAKYQSDIEQYGIFTYEEFASICSIPEDVFEAFGGKYLKVAIGKGLTSKEELEILIARYSQFWE